jgi:hypothetical protein
MPMTNARIGGLLNEYRFDCYYSYRELGYPSFEVDSLICFEIYDRAAMKSQ